jgi:mRNA-degrading endonuclease YafQ of YafQ-DinJ toxin-antitoxin module
VSYRFKTTSGFRKSLAKLTPEQKEAAKKAFLLFKQNPFDPRLRSHKIHHLSALYRKTIYAARIEADLRSVFYVQGKDVVSVDIGTHAIYRA